jgi:hypothetical protein
LDHSGQGPRKPTTVADDLERCIFPSLMWNSRFTRALLRKNRSLTAEFLSFPDPEGAIRCVFAAPPRSAGDSLPPNPSESRAAGFHITW